MEMIENYLFNILPLLSTPGIKLPFFKKKKKNSFGLTMPVLSRKKTRIVICDKSVHRQQVWPSDNFIKR